MRTSKKRAHRTTTKDLPDRDDHKQFPVGISSAVLALQYYWHEIANGGPSGLTPEQFCNLTGFGNVYGAVQDLYRKRTRVDHENCDSLGKVIHRLVNQTRNIAFVDLRAFAQFVGLPTGLFLLYTQCDSDERRCGDDRAAARKTALELLQGIRRVIEATEEYIEKRPLDQPLFRRIYDDAGEEHLADVGVLKLWADAFKNKS
jgi:hypothetical protein